MPVSLSHHPPRPPAAGCRPATSVRFPVHVSGFPAHISAGSVVPASACSGGGRRRARSRSVHPRRRTLATGRADSAMDTSRPLIARPMLAATQVEAEANGEAPRREVATIRVSSVLQGDSPRLAGEDKAHIARLAEAETPLPPILVDRRTMQVIDGMHRLMAASLTGRESIEVEFFDGSAADAFLLAVQANVTHG